MTERERFERVFRLPPFEFKLERYGENDPWPSHYRDAHEQVAWEAWQVRAAIGGGEVPVAWQERQRKLHGWTNWYDPGIPMPEPMRELSTVIDGIEYEWRLLYAHPQPTAQEVLNDGRYRWLRNQSHLREFGSFSPYVVQGQTMRPLTGHSLDFEVDNAIATRRQT